MIKITQVSRANGAVTLPVTYTTGRKIGDPPVDETAQVVIDDKDRMRQLKSLLPRQLTLVDLKWILVGIINDLRGGKQAVTAVLPYEDYLNTDLEA